MNGLQETGNKSVGIVKRKEEQSVVPLLHYAEGAVMASASINRQ